MSIKDYRRQLEQQVAQERALAEEPSWGELAGAEDEQEILGAPSGGAADVARLRRVTADAAASPSLRVKALGRLVRAEHPGTAPETALARLADPHETPSVRLAALGLLKQLAISSPNFPDWRPVFLEALRATRSEPELRAPALEALTQEGDRDTQEVLLTGLREPEKALVPPEQALRLLSNDPHTDVRGMAAEVADHPPSEAALKQALKALAGDPGSAERFKALLADGTQSTAVRQLAATALHNVAPEALKAAVDRPAEAIAEGDSALAKHIGALLRASGEPTQR
jgi:hypothetical protein